MRKAIILFALFLIPSALAVCEELNFNFADIYRDDICYNRLSIEISKANCQNNCFAEFSSIIMYYDGHEEEKEFYLPPSNTLNLVIRQANCTNRVPTTVTVGLKGEKEICTKTYALNEELERIEKIKATPPETSKPSIREDKDSAEDNLVRQEIMLTQETQQQPQQEIRETTEGASDEPVPVITANLQKEGELKRKIALLLVAFIVAASLVFALLYMKSFHLKKKKR